MKKLNLQLFAGGEDDKKDEDLKDNQDIDKKDGDTSVEDKKDTTPKLDDLMKDENFSKDLQSLMDKRVTDAIKKTEKRLKDDYEEEKRKEKLTEEEKRIEAEKQIEVERRGKELEIKARELKLDLVDVLEEEQLDTSFRELIDVSMVLNIEDRDEAKEELRERVQKVKTIFSALVDKKVEEVKKEYLKGKSPDNLGKDDNNTPPNDYEDARKKKDVKSMIGSKFKGKF